MRQLGFVFLVLLVVAGIGWWRGWFVVEAGEHQPPRVSVDRDKIAEDAAGIGALTDRAVAAFKSRAKPVTNGNGGLEVGATVVRVNSPANTVDLRVGEESFTAGVSSDVDIRVNGKPAALSQLHPGSSATLQLTPTADGKSLRITSIAQ